MQGINTDAAVNAASARFGNRHFSQRVVQRSRCRVAMRSHQASDLLRAMIVGNNPVELEPMRQAVALLGGYTATDTLLDAHCLALIQALEILDLAGMFEVPRSTLESMRADAVEALARVEDSLG